MKKLFTLSALTLALAACGGGGGGSDTTTKTVVDNSQPDNTQVDSGFCANTITLNGFTFNVSDYDQDGDGCLDTDEMKAAQTAADAKAKEEEAKRVSGDKLLSTESDVTYDIVDGATLFGTQAAIDENGQKVGIIEANTPFSLTVTLNDLKVKGPRPSQTNSANKDYDSTIVIFSKYKGREIFDDVQNKIKPARLQRVFLTEFTPLDNTFAYKCQYSDGNSASSSIPANNLRCTIDAQDFDLELSQYDSDASSKLYFTVFGLTTVMDDQDNIIENIVLENFVTIPVRIK